MQLEMLRFSSCMDNFCSELSTSIVDLATIDTDLTSILHGHSAMHAGAGVFFRIHEGALGSQNS